MKQTLTILAFSFFLTFKAFAQCGTPVLSQSYESWIQQAIEKENRFANIKKQAVWYNIPVIFHILHTGQAVGVGRNISKAQVVSQLDVLNQDFRKLNADLSTWVTQPAFTAVAADCDINFCLANVNPSGAVLPEQGIDRINVVSKGWATGAYTKASEFIDLTVKPATFWDPNKYFNVWVLDMDDSEGILGYAQFPDVPSGTVPIADVAGMGGLPNTDGVVMDYTSFGTTGVASAPHNKGRTMTHEVGHWLGLRHIWGDATCGDDYCADTPKQTDKHFGCPAVSGATIAPGCSSPNPPGMMYQNHMDYSDDKCKVMFTANQRERMLACIKYCPYRSPLEFSSACTPTSIQDAVFSMGMSVSPNPTTGEVWIDIDLLNPEDYTISVLNALGQTIKESKQTQSTGGTTKIDLTNQPAGVYFVNYKSETKSKTKRVVLQ